MIRRYKLDETEWIDAESPTEREIAEIAREKQIHPLIEHELLLPSRKSKVETHNDLLYFILHIPRIHPKKKKSFNAEKIEFDFVAGKDFLLTVHYEPIPALVSIEKQLEIQSILGKNTRATHAGYLLFAILKRLYTIIENDLDIASERARKAEAEIFEGNERRMVEVLSRINRTVIDFQRVMFNHHTLLRAFGTKASALYGADFNLYVESITADSEKNIAALNTLKETVAELRETNDSLLTHRNNEVMKYLTVMAFVTFPLTLVSNIFSMNAKTIPIIGHPFDFWIIISIMIGMAVSMFVFFRHMRWL